MFPEEVSASCVHMKKKKKTISQIAETRIAGTMSVQIQVHADLDAASIYLNYTYCSYDKGFL